MTRRKHPASALHGTSDIKSETVSLVGPITPPAPPVPDEVLSPFRALLACHGGGDSEAHERHGPVGNHPESPGRIAACLSRLRSSPGLWRALKKVRKRRASDAELQLCHDVEHIVGLHKMATLAAKDLRPHFVPTHGPLCAGGPCGDIREGTQATDTYVTHGSLQAARFASGGVLQLVDEVMRATGPRCGIALCRPPGHHASRNRSSGFCLVNNVAIAAEYARVTYPEVERVVIFDWDVHHGQGTQQIFEQSPDVLVVSVHRYDGATFYPATGAATELGSGPGRGFTVNVALPEGYGGAALWAACANVLLPAVLRFRPQLILVSAGFDAVVGDPLGGCVVEPPVFGVLTAELRRVASEVSDGRLILVLEGGYDPKVLADCVLDVARALVAHTGEPEHEESFSKPPPWLQGRACYGAIRRTCALHHTGPLRLPLPHSRLDRRRMNCQKASRDVARTADVYGYVKEKSGEDAHTHSTAGIRSSDRAIPSSWPISLASSSRVKGNCKSVLEEPAAISANISDLLIPSAVETGQMSSVRSHVSVAAVGIVQLEVQLGEFVVRIAPVPKPKDVIVSPDELWVWHDSLGIGDSGRSRLQRWRFEGVRADNSGALRCAEFRSKKHELTVRLRLGPMMGADVSLARLV